MWKNVARVYNQYCSVRALSAQTNGRDRDRFMLTPPSLLLRLRRPVYPDELIGVVTAAVGVAALLKAAVESVVAAAAAVDAASSPPI